ncbi:MAG: class IV adenylate cyclase [Planctomycetes bacterium]|nr:class IV adenylate cyclase [Planctomycetota bacterium]
MVEIEMKFPVKDFEELMSKLEKWDAEAQAPLEEADHYFNAPDRDFAQTDEALRLRRVGESNIATYKGPKEPGPTKTRTEIEVALASGPGAADAFCRMLTHLGYRAVAVVRKRRICYAFGRDGFAIQACLDEVAELGRYVEIEIVAPTPEKERAQRALLLVVGELGLKDAERRSYLEMVLAARLAV